MEGPKEIPLAQEVPLSEKEEKKRAYDERYDRKKKRRRTGKEHFSFGEPCPKCGCEYTRVVKMVLERSPDEPYTVYSKCKKGCFNRSCL